MKIFVDIGHPAHVHYFKTLIFNLKHKGHEFLITAREKDVSQELLDNYNIPYAGVYCPCCSLSGGVEAPCAVNTGFTTECYTLYSGLSPLIEDTYKTNNNLGYTPCHYSTTYYDV